jgi:hypothetical protein
LGQQNEGIFSYNETGHPVIRRSHTRDRDLKLFKEKQLEGIDLQGAHISFLGVIILQTVGDE